MERTSRVVASLGVLLALNTVSGEAQSSRVAWGMILADAYATGGPGSVVKTPSLRTLEVEAAFEGPQGRWWHFEYPVGLILQAWLSDTALGPAEIFPVPPHGEWRVPREAGRTTGRAIGLRPLGWRFVIGPEALQIEAEISGGGLLFDVPAPASNTSRLNFTAQGGIGLRINVPGGHLNSGYRFHHMSNGGRGDVNPGVESHMWYFGMALR